MLATWDVSTGRAILVTSPNTLSAGKELFKLGSWGALHLASLFRRYDAVSSSRIEEKDHLKMKCIV